jgi:phage terminase small subunit
MVEKNITTGEKYKVPARLKAATKKFFKQVLIEYDLESHHIRLLTLACEAWDRAQDTQAALDKGGLIYNDRFGCPRPRPEVKIKEQAEIIFARLIRELNLDIEPPRSGSGRPPRLY